MKDTNKIEEGILELAKKCKTAEEFIGTIETIFDNKYNLKGDLLVRAGQKIQYIITDYSRKRNRSAPLGMAGNKYDIKRYTKLLAECCTTVTKPFGTEILPR